MCIRDRSSKCRNSTSVDSFLFSMVVSLSMSTSRKSPSENQRDVYKRQSKHSSHKIHPSNPSIHPNRLPLFRRSRLFRMHPRSRRSASRSRLAANRPHLSSHHRRNLRQRNGRPPSVRNQNRTPHREKKTGAAFLFGQEIQSKSPLQRCSQKRLYQKLIQSVRGKQLHRMHSGKCSKRAIAARSERPPQPRKSWPKPRQRRSKS